MIFISPFLIKKTNKKTLTLGSSSSLSREGQETVSYLIKSLSRDILLTWWNAELLIILKYYLISTDY